VLDDDNFSGVSKLPLHVELSQQLDQPINTVLRTDGEETRTSLLALPPWSPSDLEQSRAKNPESTYSGRIVLDLDFTILTVSENLYIAYQRHFPFEVNSLSDSVESCSISANKSVGQPVCLHIAEQSTLSPNFLSVLCYEHSVLSSFKTQAELYERLRACDYNAWSFTKQIHIQHIPSAFHRSIKCII
jgi:hypothetical protein